MVSRKEEAAPRCEEAELDAFECAGCGLRFSRVDPVVIEGREWCDEGCYHEVMSEAAAAFGEHADADHERAHGWGRR